ncbi:DUF72 domain-containing protein [Pandoraea sp. XJJ-1]|uniref:DUF72 domain-containing protein n=1 Tax=unclassified Pandoraea TaxID=2624094 RepID=UPI0021C34759|nr:MULTISPECIES: DUF72 domain-containing protein [unclassified Pandoraea]WAL81018.1 DUF72 domain-containing protein [Pandoraea sp. XJJ-1]BDD93868.1 hypothetical protein PanNE5_33080 [Pandoraea sp. NE5]
MSRVKSHTAGQADWLTPDASDASDASTSVATAGQNVYIGTASWTDKSLIACKRFYPPGHASAEARLRYYASQFPMVEVDSSYYAMPSASNTQLWAERTPRAFVFNIKAFRLLTGHQTPRIALPRDLQAELPPGPRANVYYKDIPDALRDEIWRRYLEALAPLRQAGKLGLVHFQFPPWLTGNRESRAHVEACAQRMRGYGVAAEFRHRGWFDGAHGEATLAWLRELGWVNTVVDEPQGFANSIPMVWATTTPLAAVVRLHGRNQATWNVRDSTAASDRFNYDYRDAELVALVDPIRVIAKEVARVYVVFNNNYEDQGQRNARSLMSILGSDAVAP